MKIEKGDKFYSIKLTSTRNLLIPINFDLDREINKHQIQINELNNMIKEHSISIDAIKELKEYKRNSYSVQIANNKGDLE